MPSKTPDRRVGDILDAIARINDHVADIGGVEGLIRNDRLHRDAVERQLLIVAEAAAKLRGQVETFEPDIDWNAIRGMGNYIRHDYDGVEDDVIRRVLTTELQPLADACLRLRLRFKA